MKRKITILTIAFLSSVLMCANVFAAVTGSCGNSIKWTLDDSGNLTLSGSGEMWNYNYGDSPFKDYGIKTVTIRDGITRIGDYAFYSCSGLAKITSLAEIPPVCGSGVFDGVNKTNCELIVPVISVIAYKLAEVWNEFSNISGFWFSGVEDTVADGNTIRVIGNQIEISGDVTSVEVYGVNGVLIYKGKDNVVTVPSAGIYLVHVADKTRKIVVE